MTWLLCSPLLAMAARTQVLSSEEPFFCDLEWQRRSAGVDRNIFFAGGLICSLNAVLRPLVEPLLKIAQAEMQFSLDIGKLQQTCRYFACCAL